MRLVSLASPRTLVLVSDTHCLLIRAQSGHDVVCSFLERDQVDLAGAAVLSERIHGCLGLLSVAGGASPRLTSSPDAARHLPPRHLLRNVALLPSLLERRRR